MTTAVALHFPTGRYHATPWGRAVNEAAIEWPPSPWRLLRALYATWQWRAPDLAPDVVERALCALAPAPSFQLPRHAEAHTRHWYPDAAYGTDKVFDPFATLDPAAEVVVRWPSTLDDEGRKVISRLCSLLPYLGRADSLCQARLLSEAETDQLPVGGWLDPGDLGALDRPPTRVLAPNPPLDLPSLIATTTAVRRGGRTTPPGSRWLSYPAAVPAQATTRRMTPRRPSVQGVRFALDAPVRPTHHRAVLYGHVLRCAALSYAPESETLSGRRGDGVRADAHAHAHYLCLDLDEDGLLDTAVVWAPEGLTDTVVSALTRISRLRHGEPGFQPVRLAVEAAGAVPQLLPDRWVGAAVRWRSVTPFVPYRHLKRGQPSKEFLGTEINRELATRGLPAASEVRATAGPWLSFRRRRTLRDPESRGFGLDIVLDAAVAGPLALGALSHFGLGLFRPVLGPERASLAT